VEKDGNSKSFFVPETTGRFIKGRKVMKMIMNLSIALVLNLAAVFSAFAGEELNNQHANYLSPSDLKDVVFIGHRGGIPDYLHPENSMDSFRLASRLQINFFEIDVVLTKDNIPVVFHDKNLKRLTGEDRFIREVTYNELTKIKLLDRQDIKNISEVIKEFPRLLIDLTHNDIEDTKVIVDYLCKHNLKNIQTSSYIQVASKEAVDFIKKRNSEILVAYNEWGVRINNVDEYKDIADFFTLNPSQQITKHILQQIGKGKTIFAVVQNDNINEVKRMHSIGIRYIMIDNALIYNRHLVRKAFKY